MAKFKMKKLFKFVIFTGLTLTLIILFRHAAYQPTNNNTERPNVLLITIDALRPDHLGCYGYERNTSLNIDNLGKEGVIFTQAISQGPETIPSMPSLITSLYPSQHGLKGMFTNASLSVPTLAEILKKNNYYTGAIVAHAKKSAGRGGRGFDFMDFNFMHQADVITQKAVGWLNKNKDKGFFLWLHYFDVHAPYLPPYPYDEMFLSDKFKNKGKEFLAKKYYWVNQGSLLGVINRSPPKPRSLLRSLFAPRRKQSAERRRPIPLLTKQALDNTLTEEDREYYISQYDGAIRFTDDQIGILFNELKKLGLDERTLIILTADHGENLADYNKYFFHGDSLYDVLLKVPLIIKGKGIPKNKIIERQVQLIDIMPTILDISGIKKDKIEMEGVSLLPLIFDQKSRIGDYAFSEVFGFINAKSIRTEDWKLIYNLEGGRYELYNLRSDPREQHNLANLEKEKFDFLKAELKKWMEQTRLKKPPLTKPLDEKTKQKLRSLGYTQ